MYQFWSYISSELIVSFLFLASHLFTEIDILQFLVYTRWYLFRYNMAAFNFGSGLWFRVWGRGRLCFEYWFRFRYPSWVKRNDDYVKMIKRNFHHFLRRTRSLVFKNGALTPDFSPEWKIVENIIDIREIEHVWNLITDYASSF